MTIKAVTQIMTSTPSDATPSGNSTHQNSNCQETPKNAKDCSTLHSNFTQELQDLFAEVRGSESLHQRVSLRACFLN